MAIEKKPYTFRTRVLFNRDGSIQGAEIVTKAALIEGDRVLSEIETDVRTLQDPSPLAPLVAAVNSKFEELYAAEQEAKRKAAEEVERKAKEAAEAKAAEKK